MHLRAPDGSLDHTVEAVERFVEVAAERGVDEIGFTEHVYYFEQTRSLWSLPYQLDHCHCDLEPYVDAVVEAKRRGYPVKLGLEVDHQPDLADEMDEILQPYPWDYLIGSVHFVDGLGIDQEPSLVTTLGPEAAWARYYEWVVDAADHVDVLGHPDLVKFFGPELEWDWPALAGSLNGACLEVSSAGLHKPHGRLYPNPAPARGRQGQREFRSQRRPTPTTPQDVGRDIDRAIDHAQSRRLRDRHGLRPAACPAGAARVSDLRIGIGIDAHRFQEGIPLVLAGVDFPGEPGLAGHSDGDVIAHALIDAILGAAGKGDIGELFPSADPQWLDVSSIRLLQRTYEVVRMAGFELVNADCVLIGERPRISELRVAMGARLAGSMGVDIGRVTVRATTTDELGFTGRGEGLAAQAVALLRTS